MQVTFSDVVNAVMHLITPKNPQVQPHSVMQWLTREFDKDMPQVGFSPDYFTDNLLLSSSAVQQHHIFVVMHMHLKAKPWA